MIWLLGLACGPVAAADTPSAILGRWDLMLEKGTWRASWLSVEMKDGKLIGNFCGTAGGVGKVDDLKFEEGKLSFRRGDRYEAKVTGDDMIGEIIREDGRIRFTGKRFIYRPDIDGTWDMTAPGARAGAGEGDKSTLVLRSDGKTITGTLTGPRGRAVEIRDAALDGKSLSFSVKRRGRDGADRVVTYTGEVRGDKIVGTFAGPRGQQRREWSATRQRQWGEPIRLFNGKDLTGWKLVEDQEGFGNWKAQNGELVNTDRGPNIRTVETFKDFKLHLEFNLPEHGNSGVYLRGRYEVQVAADYGQPPSPGGCGAIYSRFVPSINASKPAGEWQTYDITLIGQFVTVVHNGKTLCENLELEGITGGAIDSYEHEPGPIYLQGDHSAVRYRNIVLTPARPAK